LDGLFDFLAADVEKMSKADLSGVLQRAGIDAAKAFLPVKRALEQAAAREQLAKAAGQRAAFTSKLIDVVVQPVDDVRALVRRLIQEHASAAEQPVLFNKLEQAATDRDLQTLLEDMERLKRAENADGDPRT
jgi:hypothetical protein